jgi:hypothetical protein
MRSTTPRLARGLLLAPLLALAAALAATAAAAPVGLASSTPAIAALATCGTQGPASSAAAADDPGANPVNYVEVDGHSVAYVDGAVNADLVPWVRQQERKQAAAEAAAACRTSDRCLSGWQRVGGALELASIFAPFPTPARATLALKIAAAGANSTRATKGAGEAGKGGLNLFKWKAPSSTTAEGWRAGDRMLAVPWKGTPKATWKENASQLRREMRSGEPIYETYVDRAGNLIPTKGFLNAERNLLRDRGWQYDPRTRAWVPGR